MKFTRANKTVILYATIGITVLALAVALALFYDAGYRLKGLSVVKVGSLSVIIPEKNASLFIGERLQRVSAADKEEILIPQVGSASTLVTVLKKNYLPWAKRISVAENTHTEVYPFLVKENIEPEIILQGSLQYLTLLPKLTGPQAIVKKEFRTEDSRVYAEGSRIKTECLSDLRILCDISFEAKGEITAVYQFDENPHTVIYSTSNGIFISDISPEIPRIEYQIYTGTDVSFFEENGTLQIRDSGKILKISL